MAAVLVMGLVTVPGQASAEDFLRPFEDDVAVATSDRGDWGLDDCGKVEDGIGPGNVAVGCWRGYGDIWLIQDSKAEGAQTYIYWENWLHDGSRWRPYRHGQCNNQLGAPNWGKCNKDFYESGSTNYYGGTGSRIRFQVCDRSPLPDACSPVEITYAGWISNNE